MIEKRIDAMQRPETWPGMEEVGTRVEVPADGTAQPQTGGLQAPGYYDMVSGPLTVANYADGDYLFKLPVETAVMLEMFVGIIKTISPKDPDTGEAVYLFEYEANDFMDLKANRMQRTTSGVHLPELERSPIRRYVNGLRYRRFFLRPYFFKWGQFGEQVSHGETAHSIATANKSIGRQEIRDQIEKEIVLPFIDVMEQRLSDVPEIMQYYSSFFPYRETEILYPVPWFTGHEVGIQLSLNFDIPIC